ncbi:MAG: transporter, partial [Bacteroidota bacterium]
LQANIETGSRKDIVFIPTNYLTRGSYVKLENGEEKQIEIVSKNSDWTQVISGITEQDIIVKPKS